MTGETCNRICRSVKPFVEPRENSISQYGVIVKCQKPRYMFYSAIPQSVGGTTSTEKHRKYHSYKAGILVDVAMEYFFE